ncbi:MAG: Bax inhibitor-1 family protein [Acidobacteriota bacterium]
MNRYPQPATEVLPGPRAAAELDADARGAFVVKTYAHLFAAILAFVGLEIFLFGSGMAEPIARAMLSVSWLIPLGAFMVVSWLASRIAGSADSIGLQYLALFGFVVAQALIFVPLLFMANMFAPGVIQSAALLTAIGFTGLSAVAFVTRKDFSFLRGIVFWGFIVALVAIVGASLFGFALGTFFSVAMIGLAGAAILYDTSNVLHHFPEDRYVAGALQLFASVALLFWYLINLLMSFSSD